MAERTGLTLFGFEIKRSKKAEADESKLKSIVPSVDTEGAGYVTASGSHYGQYLDIDGDKSKDNATLINKYRGVAMHPEVDAAIEDIINEMIVAQDDEPVSVNMENVKISESIKKKIQEEFQSILYMLKF